MPCLIILQEKCYLALHFRGKGIQLYYILLYVLNGLLFEMFQKAEKFFSLQRHGQGGSAEGYIFKARFYGITLFYKFSYLLISYFLPLF